MNKIKKAAKYVLPLLAVAAAARADAVDYGATLSTNLTIIDTIWGSVATIMIGSALVAVGTRFFRKAR